MANGTGDGSKIIKRRTKHSQSSEPPAKQPRSNFVSQDVNQTNTLSNEWHSNAGMITRVLMKNFMCHGELDYRPKERLNFLHGANGSGKVISCIMFIMKSAGLLHIVVIYQYLKQTFVILERCSVCNCFCPWRYCSYEQSRFCK